MRKFIPFANGDFFYIPKARDPDREELYWRSGWGDFSAAKEEAFKKHIEKIGRLNIFFSGLNGKRIKAVIKEEGLWYGRRGLERLLLR